MTHHRDLKNIIRERQTKTGESYTAARIHVMAARAGHLGLPPDALLSKPVRCVEAAVIVAKLGLEPLPLSEHGLEDVAAIYEPFRRPDPYAPLWKRLTAKPRPSFEMHPIAWDAVAFHADDEDESPVCDAAELAEQGDVEAARELLMEVLSVDLRCIDAHAHLGNLVFDRSPRDAIVHYEIGVKLGELSLGPAFDGLLLWGSLHNRPFLRCLQGYGLCLWRLGRTAEARAVFARLLAMNPNDEQGVRFWWLDLQRGRTWEESCAGERATLH